MAGFDDAALRVVHQDDEPLKLPAACYGELRPERIEGRYLYSRV